MTDLPVGRHVVIAVCCSEKKHRQSLDDLWRYVGRRSGGVSFSLVKMSYDAGTDTLWTETGEQTADVVLHKVSTLGPGAGGALQRWCAVASGWRVQRGLPPVIVVDPVEMTQVVLRRSLVVNRLDSRLRQLLCSTPRSWLWSRGGAMMVPLGHSSSSSSSLLYHNYDDNIKEGNVHQPRLACSESSVRFWIVKTDLSSGPAFTHQMVVWKGNLPCNSLPDDVQRRLPSEADVFVVQEFLVGAIPVLVKVYSIGTYVFVKAVSTALLVRSALADAGHPLCIDSQTCLAAGSGKLDEKQAAHWRSFLAEGGPAHAKCTLIAAQVAEELRLTLFGFDLLLVPQQLCQNGGTISLGASTAAAFPSNAPLFDDTTGDPTPLLSTAIPVLVDLNYFPGFAGVEDASERLLKVIESKVMDSTSLVKTIKPVEVSR